MPFEKDKMKKKDEEKLEEMQKEIEETVASNEAAAESEDAPEAEAPKDAETASSEELEKLQKENEAVSERLTRLQADFENFRRRTRQEKEDLAAVVAQGFMSDMLPLLDNFERAMAAETGDIENFRKGIEMIFTQFRDALVKEGLEVIKTEGEKFDPNFHQAVMRVQDPEKEDDTIAMELQKGYMVKGRVVRPSMVQVVSN